MAEKKEAKQKASPSGQKEKNRKETESSTGTKNTSKGAGQNAVQKEQPQGRQNQRPEEGAQGQWRVDAKDLQEGWETIKEIDKVLGHLEGRLDKVTAVIRQVAVQGKALELDVSEEGGNGAGSGESSEELETPALQSSMGEHRIVNIQESAPGPSKPGEPQKEPDPSPSSVREDYRREEGTTLLEKPKERQARAVKRKSKEEK